MDARRGSGTPPRVDAERVSNESVGALASRATFVRSHAVKPTISATTQQRLVIALILWATLNALLWSFVRIPGAGGPDEESHYGVVRTMVQTGSLAEFDGYDPGAFAGLSVRAPVAHEIIPNAYAILVAAVVGFVGLEDEHVNIHIARLFSVAIYPMTLWIAFLVFRRIFMDMRLAPVLGVAMMTTVPMFTLIHSYYNNDAPAIAVSTLAIYALIRANQHGFTQRNCLLLGASLGLVGLHKYTGFIVFPGAAVVLVWRHWRQPTQLIRAGVVVLGIAAAISSWWYIRNWSLYGDPVGIAVTQAAVDVSGGAPVPPRTRGLNVVEFLQESSWIGENFATTWAGYGLEKLKIPGAAYIVLSGLVVAAALGLAVRAMRARTTFLRSAALPPLIIMALLHLGLWMVSFWSSYTVDVALNGRYVFPTYVPFAALMLGGLSTFAAWHGRVEAALLLCLPIMLAASGSYFVHELLPDVLAFT